MRSVTIRQVECFLEVASAGNFSRAAARLGVAQPALSLAVKDLEAEIGVRLFDRTTRRVELTEAGREFRDATSKLVEEFRLAIRQAHDLVELKRGRIRIAAPPLLAAVILPSAIAEFNQRHGGINVKLLDLGTEQIIESVRQGDADCGLGTFPPGLDGVSQTALARDKLMVFCNVDRLPVKPVTTWGDLEGRPLIALTQESGIRRLVELGYESAQIACRPTYEVTHITTALALVEAGLGMSVLPSYALAAVRGSQVTGRVLAGPEISREISMIHASGRSRAPAVDAFEATLRQKLRAIAPDADRP